MNVTWRWCEAPHGAVDPQAHTEVLGGTTFTHRYLEGGELTWHAVSTGDEGAPVVVFVHGYPESWYAWHHQMRALASHYRCIAVDLPGFGQSEKPDPDAFDYDYANVARCLADLIRGMGLDCFHLVSHDRGTVVCDHLCAVPGMNGRIAKYVRMQQSGCVPHGEPRPPHELFRSRMAVEAFGDPANVVQDAYVRNALVAFRPAQTDLERMARELGYEGVAEGAAASFKSADFDREWADRMGGLFAAMTMPVLFLQGALDAGQSPQEYARATAHVADGTLQFVHAGHFLHLERPDAVSAAIHAFLLHHPAAGTAPPLAFGITNARD